MQPLKKKKGRPEHDLQQEVVKKLRYAEWLVKSTHGNEFQSGFPDLYAAHKQYGSRWIECKIESHLKFTQAQTIWFPQFSAAGVGIWIVTDVRQVPDILFQPANWHMYLEIMKL